MSGLLRFGIGAERVDLFGEVGLDEVERRIAAEELQWKPQRSTFTAAWQSRDVPLQVRKRGDTLTVTDPFPPLTFGNNTLRPRFRGHVTAVAGRTSISGAIRHSRVFDVFLVAFIPVALFLALALRDEMGVGGVLAWGCLPSLALTLLALAYTRHNTRNRIRIRELLQSFLAPPMAR